MHNNMFLLKMATAELFRKILFTLRFDVYEKMQAKNIISALQLIHPSTSLDTI